VLRRLSVLQVVTKVLGEPVLKMFRMEVKLEAADPQNRLLTMTKGWHNSEGRDQIN
jgi:hypothetical protein